MPQVGAVITAVAGVASLVQGRKASKAASRQAAEQRTQQALATRRERRGAVRRAQIARAQAVAAGQAAGAFGGSAIAGGSASVGSQLGAQLGFSTQGSGLAQNISRFGEQANSAVASSQAFGSAFNFGVGAGFLDPVLNGQFPSFGTNNLVGGAGR